MGVKKLLILGSLVLLLAAIPLTVYFSQQQQETRSQAQKSTNVCFATTAPPAITPTTTTTGTPTPPTATPTTPASAVPSCSTTTTRGVGETFTVDVIVNPGSNTISTMRLNIVYDATKLSVDNGAFTLNSQVVSQVADTLYAPGSVTARLGIIVNSQVGVDPTRTLSSPMKVGTIQFKVLSTATAGTSSITFGESLVLSTADTDGPEEDVLNQKQPLSVVIATAPSPSATPTSAPVTVQAPVCNALNVDRTTSGTAPFAITFTANGRDADGTISKVTFDFGDGPVQDVTQSGGIGTNSVSTQVSHTFNNPGTYSASVILTDNSGTLSTKSAACTQTITVAQRTGGADPGTPATGSATPTSTTPISTTAPTSTIVVTQPPVVISATPGPGGVLVGIGAIGAVLSVIGGLLFFAL